MTINQWCERCDELHATHKITYRTDIHLPKWSTPNGEIYVQEVCLHCLQEVEEEIRNGIVWDLQVKETTNQ